MTSQPTPGKDRSVTREAFAGFLFWLSTDREKAAKEYLVLRRKLVTWFVRKGCAHAEDLADRTLDRVVAIVHHEPGKYTNPVSLCCGVARRVWLEYLREAVPIPLEDDNMPPVIQDLPDFRDHEVACLESCLSQLSPRDRELITQYHQFQGSEKIETRKRMAQLHGGLNRLRLTAHRIRAKLFDCVSGCVQHSEFTNIA